MDEFVLVKFTNIFLVQCGEWFPATQYPTYLSYRGLRGGTEKYFSAKISSGPGGLRKGLESSCLNELRHTHAQVRGCIFPGVSARVD